MGTEYHSNVLVVGLVAAVVVTKQSPSPVGSFGSRLALAVVEESHSLWGTAIVLKLGAFTSMCIQDLSTDA